MICEKYSRLLFEIEENITSILYECKYDTKNIKFKYDKLVIYTNILKSDILDNANFPNSLKCSRNNILYYEMDKSEIKGIFVKNFADSDNNCNDNDCNPIASRMCAQIAFNQYDDSNWGTYTIEICDYIIKAFNTNSESIWSKSIRKINLCFNKMQNKRAYLPRCVLAAIIKCCYDKD